MMPSHFGGIAQLRTYLKALVLPPGFEMVDVIVVGWESEQQTYLAGRREYSGLKVGEAAKAGAWNLRAAAAGAIQKSHPGHVSPEPTERGHR